MTPTRLVGVYLGPTRVQVDVYDLDGNVLERGAAPITEQTTIAWERALREATPALPDTAICSVTSTSGTAVLVDRYGEPVFQPLMYNESASATANMVRSELDVDQSSEYNIFLSPTSPLPKILECREEHPRKFRDVEWILSPATWLLYRLANGTLKQWDDVETDWTNAMKFGADITTPIPSWYDWIFESVDLSPSLFPSIRPPGSYIGIASGELAEMMGFDGIKLFQGITDGSASVLANGCFEEGDVSMSFGAASTIKYVADSIEPHDALYYHRHPLDGYLPGASFDSGSVLRWICETLLNRTLDSGLDLAMATDEPGYEVFLQGNRSPFFNPDIGTTILGITPDETVSVEDVHAKLVRGFTTAIVISEWTYFSLIEAHFETTIDTVKLMNVGEFTSDTHQRWWNDRRATYWNRPIEEMQPRTTVGPLIPATLITAVYDDVEEAANRLLRRRSVIEPSDESDWKDDDRRTQFLDRWNQIASLYENQ